MNNSLNKNIRVRFAPSPTGNLHIGGLRAALFNHIFARQQNGKFIIRIEDTDFSRNKEEYTKAIIDAFEWCNIRSDEPLVYQSQRIDIYNKYIENIVNNGFAYWVDEPNEEGIIGKVLKLKVDKKREFIEFNDIIRGKIQFSTKEIDDFIIVRSDKTPLYNLVVVIDDIEMQISHIIRGEEHLPNTPKQILLYEAFGIEIPKFAHLPLILSPEGKKLSKRDAATSVIDYKKMGFLPDALCMYLIRLGWAYKDQEIFTFEELLKYFDLSNVHSAGAMFDFKKLLWMNSVYIKKENSKKLLNLCKEFEFNLCNDWTEENKIKCIDLFKDRSESIIQLKDFLKNIYKSSIEYDLNILNEIKKEIEDIKLKEILNYLLIEIENKNFASNQIKEKINNISSNFKLEMPVIFKLLRFILLGITASPSIYTIIDILGKDELINRLNNFKKNI